MAKVERIAKMTAEIRRSVALVQMKHNDYVGAKGRLLSAKESYAQLEFIDELIKVCDVALAAESGSVSDWYSVLQADECDVDLKYTEMIRTFEPVKSKFSEIESALGLIEKAHRVFSVTNKPCELDWRGDGALVPCESGKPLDVADSETVDTNRGATSQTSSGTKRIVGERSDNNNLICNSPWQAFKRVTSCEVNKSGTSKDENTFLNDLDEPKKVDNLTAKVAEDNGFETAGVSLGGFIVNEFDCGKSFGDSVDAVNKLDKISKVAEDTDSRIDGLSLKGCMVNESECGNRSSDSDEAVNKLADKEKMAEEIDGVSSDKNNVLCNPSEQPLKRVRSCEENKSQDDGTYETPFLKDLEMDGSERKKVGNLSPKNDKETVAEETGFETAGVSLDGFMVNESDYGNMSGGATSQASSDCRRDGRLVPCGLVKPLDIAHPETVYTHRRATSQTSSGTKRIVSERSDKTNLICHSPEQPLKRARSCEESKSGLEMDAPKRKKAKNDKEMVAEDGGFETAGVCLGGFTVNESNCGNCSVHTDDAVNKLDEKTKVAGDFDSEVDGVSSDRCMANESGWDNRASDSDDAVNKFAAVKKNMAEENDGVSLDGSMVNESECETSSSDSGDAVNKLDICQIVENMKNNKNKYWQTKDDMLSSLEEDPVLCMKGVCALHRQKITKRKSVSGSHIDNRKFRGFSKFAALRGSEMAEFLTDNNPKGELKKTAEDLEVFMPEGPEDCIELAQFYSNELFTIYQNHDDPFFGPY